MAPSSSFSIAQVTPYPWEDEHEVNDYVASVSRELVARGHRVAILAPSRSAERVRTSRRELRSARGRPESLLQAGGSSAEAALIAVGEVLDVPRARPTRSRPTAVPIDVARTVEELLTVLTLDFVHVHEPFAPSVSSAALRHSRSLNIGSFHAPTERLLSTQVARRFVQTFFGRLDARTASFGATGELMARHFPAHYRVVLPGVRSVALDRGGTVGIGEAARGAMQTGGEPAVGVVRPVRLVLIEQEERSALRLLVRALGRMAPRGPWTATIVSARGESNATPIRLSLRDRVRFLSPGEAVEEGVLQDADVIVCASQGIAPAPGLILQALGQGVVPVVSRLAVYEECLIGGRGGLTFAVGDVLDLAGQLERVIDDQVLRESMREAGLEWARSLTWARTADQIEEVYGEVAARRHDPRGDQLVGRRLAGRRLIDVDLHMHTDHSNDCATPVEVLLATAREQGLGAIAVTDHNEISGALEAREQAERAGVKVIVAEEVMTATQGEVIGLFINEKIPRGLTLAETVVEIKRQGGLVYVPHPFDRMHSVPDYEHLLGILDDVDAIEIFNPRVAIGAFNEEAARFAAKYRLIAGAGSDSHVAQGLGSVRIRMRDFDGPEEFLQSLREADITTRPTSLLYVQALKFLQTKATPAGARRARRARRVRRATGG